MQHSPANCSNKVSGDTNLTPIDAVMDAARSGTFTDDHGFRFLARLGTLKRMMYYVYGGWAQGTNLNEYPPAALEEYELTGALIRP